MQTEFRCQHYERKCLVEAPCCKIFYFCKICHDDKYQGPKADWCKAERMDFSGVQKVKCLACQTQQQPSEICSKCEVKFGDYSCLKCMLYENNKKKVTDIFHCDECKMCRRGKRQKFFHCGPCGYCRAISEKDDHKCIEDVADSQCPICLQVLKYSTKYYIAVGCGHLIHLKCLKGYKSINCPVCGMAMEKMGDQWNKNIEKQIQSTKDNLPEELRDTKVNILCNQCLHKTMDADFHFFGVKCEKCGTHNTKMI